MREVPLFVRWGRVREGPIFMGWGSIYQSNGRSIIYGMGVFKVRVGQAKGIGRVYYFWDRALLFIGMGE